MSELGILRSPALTLMEPPVQPPLQPPLQPSMELPDALAELAPLVAQRLTAEAHGDMPGWIEALNALPALNAEVIDLSDRVSADGPAAAADTLRLRQALMALRPWRKGPFSLFGIDIDTEWRSDWKWRRVEPHLESLAGERVLDVGCGNGYFGWRMLEAGARQVVGVDPAALFCVQHQAVSHYLGHGANLVLPLKFEELPPAEFDTVFSMGVIYHRRDPLEHAQRLHRHTRPGGRLVLESLVVAEPEPLIPQGRYARMRNVWSVPTPSLLCHWMAQAGFVDIRLVDVSTTSLQEQRTTEWMPFESLAEALAADDLRRTVEGHPAPVRAVVIGRKAG